MSNHSYEIRWTSFSGKVTTSLVTEASSPDDAKAHAILNALLMGWPGNPRPWEFWRRGDTWVDYTPEGKG